jgi:tetratricopeptide (TPR) repeat protein
MQTRVQDSSRMEPARSIPGWHIEEPVFEGFAARTDYPGGPSGCICRFLLRSCCLPQMAGGSASVFAGQSEEALDQIGVAMRLDPHYMGYYPHFQGRAFFTLRRYEEAQHASEQAVSISPGWPMTHVMLAAAMAALGNMDAARAKLDEALRISADLNLRHIRRAYPYRDDADLDHLASLLRSAGLPE